MTEWPLQSTCSDVWSLVYDHDCSAVVVLCNPTSGVANVRIGQHQGASRLQRHLFLYSTVGLSIVLAGEHSIQEVRPGFHRRAPLTLPRAEHQELGVQDQQKDRFSHRADGWRQGAVQDVSALPANVLASGTQSTHVDQRARRAHEPRRTLAPKDRLRPCRCRIAVSIIFVILKKAEQFMQCHIEHSHILVYLLFQRRALPCRRLLRRQRVHRAGHSARRSRCLSSCQDRSQTPAATRGEHCKA